MTKAVNETCPVGQTCNAWGQYMSLPPGIEVDAMYQNLRDVAMLNFFGLGMSYMLLKRAAFTAVGHTLFTSAFALTQTIMWTALLSDENKW